MPRDCSEEQINEIQATLARFQKCLRCDSKLEFAGRRSFHEGAKMGFWFGDLGELFVNRESFDVYVCQSCGKVEFYLTDVGKKLREPNCRTAESTS
ncbi:MAG: hypothetical protein AAF585_20610 [Verrucomicrobiota bacterium]